jgi:hypothetical protein
VNDSLDSNVVPIRLCRLMCGEACLAGGALIDIWAAPCVRALPKSIGQRPYQGQSPSRFTQPRRGKPRRTSGGRAAAKDF